MKKIIILLLLGLAFLLPSCQTEAPLPVSATIPSTVMATQTPVPPTETMVLSSTPKPTLTPTPTIEPPEILSKYLSGIRIVNLINFEAAPTSIDYNSDLVNIIDGEMQMRGDEWQGGMNFRSKFNEGEGVMFDIKFLSEDKPTTFVFETFFDHGTWWTDDYRRFGMYLTSSPQSDLWMGKVGTGNYLSGKLVIKPDVQYRVVLAVGKDADFLGLIWNPENPESNRYFHQPMGEKWFDNDWFFVINGAKGKMSVDNLMPFFFDGFRK